MIRMSHDTDDDEAMNSMERNDTYLYFGLGVSLD